MFWTRVVVLVVFLSVKKVLERLLSTTRLNAGYDRSVRACRENKVIIRHFRHSFSLQAELFIVVKALGCRYIKTKFVRF